MIVFFFELELIDKLTNLQTHKLTNLPTHQLTNLQTYKPTYQRTMSGDKVLSQDLGDKVLSQDLGDKVLSPYSLVMTPNNCNFCGSGLKVKTYSLDWNYGWLYCDACSDKLTASIDYNYKVDKEFDIRKFKTLFPEIDTSINYSVLRTNGEVQHDWGIGKRCLSSVVNIVDSTFKLAQHYDDDSDIVVWFCRKSTLSIKAIRLSDFYKYNEEKLKHIPIDEFRRRTLSVIV